MEEMKGPRLQALPIVLQLGTPAFMVFPRPGCGLTCLCFFSGQEDDISKHAKATAHPTWCDAQRWPKLQFMKELSWAHGRSGKKPASHRKLWTRRLDRSGPHRMHPCSVEHDSLQYSEEAASRDVGGH